MLRKTKAYLGCSTILTPLFTNIFLISSIYNDDINEVKQYSVGDGESVEQFCFSC